MCGISGYIGRQKLDPEVIDATLAKMHNRGPDHRQAAMWKWQANYVYFLHSRLSIIDLDPRSHQPFTVADCTLIFNGEIYNYLELRRRLLERNIELRTDSDTEVLLHYYLLYGKNCVDHFEGMWSFAIFDRSHDLILLSRDRFAEKPLYYACLDDGIYFGSEIKYLKTLAQKNFEVNHRQILRYLVNGYRSLYKQPATFFRQVVELPYASNMIIDAQLGPTIQRYWRPQYHPQSMTRAEAIEGTREHLLNSVKLRLRADVPMAFLPERRGRFCGNRIDRRQMLRLRCRDFFDNRQRQSLQRIRQYHGHHRRCALW